MWQLLGKLHIIAYNRQSIPYSSDSKSKYLPQENKSNQTFQAFVRTTFVGKRYFQLYV